MKIRKVNKNVKRLTAYFLNLLLLCASLCIGRSTKRRYAVRPLNRNRKRYGHYSTLVKFIKQNDEEQFFKYTRMSPAMFDLLLSKVEPYLQRTKCQHPLPPAMRLIMTLHYLSEGCSMQQIAWDYFVGKSTVHYVIKATCNILWEQLAPIYLKIASEAGWLAISKEFYRRWNMPNCFGSVDGKHVVIQAPKNSGSNFYNYKKTFSIALMATCDAYYRFVLVDIGAAGTNHDSYVFSESGFGSAVINKTLKIPNAAPLPNSTMVLPHFLVADSAFPLHVNIMRPYAGRDLNETRKIFNYRLSRARRTIENTFGILAQRWRILRKPIIGNIETCEQIVKSTVVLHNFLQKGEEDIPISKRRYCPTGNADWIDEKGMLHEGQWRRENNNLLGVRRLGSNNASRSIIQHRDNLAKYFTSRVGSVPWQLNHVLAGSIPSDFEIT